MPWHIEQRNGQFVVVKDADDSVAGRHDSRVQAIRQLRVLYASEEDLTAGGGFDAPAQPMHTIPAASAPLDCPPGHHKMPDGSCMANDKMDGYQATEPVTMETQNETAPWDGVLTVEGIESGDGRMFKVGSLSWDLTPADGMPLMWQRVTSHGGQGDESVRVGSVTQVWREPDPGGRPDVAIIRGRGFLDLGNPDGAEVARRMHAGVMSGNSVDVDSVKDANVEFVYDQPAAGQAPAQPGQPADITSMFKKPQLTIYNKGRVRGTTMVEFPAFTEARLGLIKNDDVVAGALVDFHLPILEALREVMAQPITPDELEDREDALVAAGHVMEFTDTPPREWFDEPTDVTPYGALTITDSGRLYGYLAPAKVHHRSFHDRTVYAPMGKVDYARFMSGETIVSDGGRVVTGPITMNCDHATTQRPITAGQAQEHYDNSCSLFATARVGENKNGVWVAGAVLRDVTPAMIQRAMACKLSGDWRAQQDRPGWRELTAALLVPVPGFPMARVASSVRVEDGQLVAAAVPVRFVHDESGVPEFTTVDERRALALRLAKSIQRDSASRIAEIKARVAFRQFSEAERRTLADSGDALPDGSYPIPDVASLRDAIHAYGRSNPSKRAAVRAHIMKRAAALGQTRLIPRTWLSSDAIATFDFNPHEPRDHNGRWTDGMTPSTEELGPFNPHHPSVLSVLAGKSKIADATDASQAYREIERLPATNWENMSDDERSRVRGIAKGLKKWNGVWHKKAMDTLDRLERLRNTPVKPLEGMNPAGM